MKMNQFSDEVGHEYAYKQVDYYIYQQKKLLEKFIGFRDSLRH
jgi:hypothetical protein